MTQCAHRDFKHLVVFLDFFMIFQSHMSDIDFSAVQSMSWPDLAEKKVAAPIKPKIKSSLDVSNFSDDMTKESPSIMPEIGDHLFKVKHTSD